MKLKPFEAGRYDEESIVVSNPATGRQALFSESEFGIVKFLKKNEKQSLLALLMPNIGVARKTHITQCLQVLRKLKRLQIVDYQSITGRKQGSNTNTVDLPPQSDQIEFTSLNALAATVCGVGARLFSPIGTGGLMALVVVLAATALAFFPFEAIGPALQLYSPPYYFLFFLVYLNATFAFCLRTLVQAGFLRTFGRELLNPVFVLFFPLLGLKGDKRAANLLGFKARAQMAILGLGAPFALAGLWSLLALSRFVDPVLAFTGFASSVMITLVLACPLFRFDGADLLQTLFFREELEEKVAHQVREIFQTKGSPSREMLFSVLLTLGWLLAWLDCLRSFWETTSGRIAEDLAGSASAARAGALITIMLLCGLALMPVMVILFHYFRGRGQSSRRRVVVEKGKVKESLTFEERIAALEKIPLFAYLKDHERLALLNEMQPAFYKDGDYLVHQGELGREFFVLVKGHANCYFSDMQGKTFLLADLSDGDAFGEIALIDDVPRTASIVSDGGCILLVLRKDGFDHFAASLGSPDRVKSMVRLTSFFRRHPLFSKLGPLDQAQLIDRFRFQAVIAGERIPDADENFHVLYSGSVRVESDGNDTETILQADDCFGYSNPLGNRYTAVEGTGLLTVAKTEFNNLIWEKLVEKPELFI